MHTNEAHTQAKIMFECSCKRIAILLGKLKSSLVILWYSQFLFHHEMRCQFLKDICIFGCRWKWPSAHFQCMSSVVYISINFVWLWCVDSVGLRVFDIEIDDNKAFCPSDYFHRQWLSQAPDVSCIVTVSVHFSALKAFPFANKLLHVDCEVFVIWILRYALFTNWMYSNGLKCIYLKRDPFGRIYQYLILKWRFFFFANANSIAQWFTKECCC